jgi:hypothetical protein
MNALAGNLMYTYNALDPPAKLAYYAPLSSSGVGTWTSTTPYPLSLYYAGCSTYANDIYCVDNAMLSGSTSFPTNYVYYAPISSTGIGTWTTTNGFPFAVDDAYCETLGSGGGYFGGGGPD